MADTVLEPLSDLLERLFDAAAPSASADALFRNINACKVSAELLAVFSTHVADSGHDASHASTPAAAVLDYFERPIIDVLRQVLAYLNCANLYTETGDARGKLKGSASSSPPPLDLISLDQMKVLYTFVELTWVAIIRPVVRALAGNIPDPKHASSLILSENALKLVRETLSGTANIVEPTRVWSVISLWISFTTHRKFASLMLTRNIGRIVLTLLVLSNVHRILGGSSDSSTQILLASLVPMQVPAQKQLQSLLDSGFKTLIVSELRSVGLTTGTPKWLKEASAALFAAIIQSQRGVEVVIRGYLQCIGVDSAEHAAIVQVARLISSVPASVPVEQYISNIGKQLVELFVEVMTPKDAVAFKIAAFVVIRVAHLHFELCNTHILQPLLVPLRVAYHSLFSDNMSDVAEYISPYQATIPTLDDQICKCCDLYASIVNCGPLAPSFAQALRLSGVAEHILAVYAHCYHASSGPAGSEPSLIDPASAFCSTIVKSMSPNVVIELFDKILTDIRHYAPYSDPKLFANVSVCFRSLIKGKSQENGESKGDLSIESLLASIKAPQEESPPRTLQTGLDGEIPAVNDVVASIMSDIDNFNELAGDNAGVDVETDTMGQVIRATSAVTQAFCALFAVNSSSDINNSEPRIEGTVSFMDISSDYYIHCLRCYISPWLPHQQPSESESREQHCDKGATSPSWDPIDQAQYGVAFVTIQSVIPLEYLLKDGIRIIEILLYYLKHAADHIIRQQFESQNADLSSDLLRTNNKAAGKVPSNNISAAISLDISSSKSKPKALIEELASEDFTNESTELPLKADESPVDEEMQCTDVVLSLITSLLDHGNKNRTAVEESLIQQLLEPLQIIAFRATDEGLSERANELAFAVIMRHKHADARTTNTHGQINNASYAGRIRAIHDEYLVAEEPAMRALGIRNLVQLTKEVITTAASPPELDDVLIAILGNMNDLDSFVYLNALSGLKHLSCARRSTKDRILDALLTLYSGVSLSLQPTLQCSDGDPPAAVVFSPQTSPNLYATRLRVLIGEAVCLILKAGGDVSGVFSPRILTTAIQIARKRLSIDRTTVVNEHFDVSSLKLDKTKLGPDTEPSNRSVVDDSMDDLLLRQSAFSVLAETVALMGWAAMGHHLADVLDIATGVLMLETQYSTAANACRRSAVWVLKHVVTTMGRQLLQAKDGGHYLRACYRAFQAASSDKDDVIKWQCINGLAEIDDFMMSFVTGATS